MEAPSNRNITEIKKKAESGINSSETTVKIVLGDYPLTKDTVTRVDLEALKAIVANKLNSKYDTSKQYSYSVIRRCKNN